MDKEKVKLTPALRQKIVAQVQSVLDKSHRHLEKRQIKDGHERLQMACPYCGDSAGTSFNDLRKKRGNLYWNDLYFHCYNCSKHVSLTQFFRDNRVEVQGEDLFTIANYIKENKGDFAKIESLEFTLFKDLYNLGVPIETFLQHTNSYRINDKTYRAAPYLKSRKLEHAYKFFTYDPRRFSLYILNLSADGKKVLGCQIRNLKEKKRFWTYNIEKLRSICNMETVIQDTSHLEKLKKLSTIFNILRIDVTREFTVFEGPFDALFMNNAIALSGVDKETFAFDELPTVRYFLDNDIAGQRKSIEKIKKGKEIFLWRKYLKETGLDKYKIKDLNDLVLRFDKSVKDPKEQRKFYLFIEDCFSADPHDIVWL